MSIESDIRTALVSVAGGRVYTDAAPEKKELPYVVYRRIENEPIMTLIGYEGTTRSNFVFESWATTKAVALSTAASVQTAIEAAAGITIKYREPVGPEITYEPQSNRFMEPVIYSFWHA